MLLKLILLCLYALLLFILAMIIETVAWYDSYLTSKLLSPVSQSVRQLKLFLDSRGLSYTKVIEKSELIELIGDSGSPSEGELIEAGLALSEDQPQHTNFTGSSHFYELVEDTKDSIWIVQVVYSEKHKLLLDNTWNELGKKVTQFGVRTGIYDCSIYYRLCEEKEWFSPRLIMAIPQGHRMKDKVLLLSYPGPNSVESIFSWLNVKLSTRINIIKSLDDLKTKWINVTKSDRYLDTPVKVVLISKLKSPPMFYSALTVKFSGRVKFGVINLQFSMDPDSRKLNNLYRKKAPVYFILTPEKTMIYGERRGEYFNTKSLDLFLRTMYPEVNDIFLLMLALVNILGSFQLAVKQGTLFQKMWSTLWRLLLYNGFLILMWLPILAVLHLPYLNSFTDFRLYLVRIYSGSDMATHIRHYWKFYKNNTKFLSLTYVVFMTCSTCIIRILQPQEETDNNNNEPWWGSTLDGVSLFGPPVNPLNQLPTTSLDEGMERLIEQLEVPTLWLQPRVSTEYINALPVWQYAKTGNHLNGETMQGSPSTLAPPGVMMDDKCVICLEEFVDSVWMCCLPCNHGYHSECIKQCLVRDKHMCPVCRQPANKNRCYKPHQS